MSSTVSDSNKAFVTDFLASATSDGEWRMKYNGYVVCSVIIGARTPCNCGRRAPFPIDASSTISFEFNPTTDGATANINVGGYIYD